MVLRRYLQGGHQSEPVNSTITGRFSALAVSSPLLKSVSQTGAARVAEATAREKEAVPIA